MILSKERHWNRYSPEIENSFGTHLPLPCPHSHVVLIGAYLWNAYGLRDKTTGFEPRGKIQEYTEKSLEQQNMIPSISIRPQHFIKEFLPSHLETIFGSVSDSFNRLGYLVTLSQGNQSKPTTCSAPWDIMSLPHSPFLFLVSWNGKTGM